MHGDDRYARPSDRTRVRHWHRTGPHSARTRTDALDRRTIRTASVRHAPRLEDSTLLVLTWGGRGRVSGRLMAWSRTTNAGVTSTVTASRRVRPARAAAPAPRAPRWSHAPAR